MKIFIGFFIFCLVLFIYLHIQFHIKKSNDLEIYEIDDASKDKLEEICDMRQPVLIDFDNQKIIDTTNRKYILDNYHAFEIKIRNVKETETNNDLYVPLPLHASDKLFNEDKNSSYFSENNSDFLNETGVIKNLKYNDEYLRPYMVSNMNYDIMLGSEGTCTPFRYEINYRNFLICTEGSVEIKMAPPQSIKYLYPVYDYENLEFRSPVNPWNVQPKYLADFDKIKCLEFSLPKAKTVFIPAYWWYSIKFTKNSSLSCLNYRTYMNNLAISPYIGMHILQLQNIKRNTTKNAHLDDLKIDNTNSKNNEPEDNVNNVNNVANIKNNNVKLDENLVNLDVIKNNQYFPEPILMNENIGSEIN